MQYLKTDSWAAGSPQFYGEYLQPFSPRDRSKFTSDVYTIVYISSNVRPKPALYYTAFKLTGKRYITRNLYRAEDSGEIVRVSEGKIKDSEKGYISQTF